MTKEIWPKETKKTKQFVRLFGWPIFEAICLKYSPISTPKGQFKQSESKLGKFELIFAPHNFAPHTGWSLTMTESLNRAKNLCCYFANRNLWHYLMEYYLCFMIIDIIATKFMQTWQKEHQNEQPNYCHWRLNFWQNPS